MRQCVMAGMVALLLSRTAPKIPAIRSAAPCHGRRLPRVWVARLRSDVELFRDLITAGSLSAALVCLGVAQDARP